MKKMGWVLPTLVGAGIGFGLGWYVKSMQKTTAGTSGLYGYHHGHMGAVMLPGEGEEFRDLYSQARIPGQRAMGLGAAYASIPGMAHFPGAPARAGYRNAMGY